MPRDARGWGVGGGGLMRCTSMTKGRVRCPNEATVLYLTTRVGRQDLVTAQYPRCDEHPLGNALSARSLLMTATPAPGEVR